MTCHAFFLAFAATTALSGCMTNAPERETTPSSLPAVSNIELSQTVGNVGEQFRSQITLHSRRLGASEVEVRSLPPGLRFDKEQMQIVGVPKAPGFFSVTIAVRKFRGPGIHFETPQGAWMSERLDLDIYRPIDGDNQDLAMNDY